MIRPSPTSPKPRILQAVEALQSGDRHGAVALLAAELRDGPPHGDRWKSVSALAGHIGEIDLSLEAARRFAQGPGTTLDKLLFYWGELAKFGRDALIERDIAALPHAIQDEPTVLHLRGTLAGQHGDFERAEALYRQALARSELLPQTWFALAMIRTFADGDRDLARMEALRPRIQALDPAIYARYLYGLAKAWHDCGDRDRAFAYYRQGAEIRRREQPYDRSAMERQADALCRDFTRSTMERLVPSGTGGEEIIFVNGLPRSGSTLVEQILTSHSQVGDGGEVNLLRAALIPTVDYSMAGALRYQQSGRGGADPWGEVARDYLRLMRMRFTAPGRIIDKTLSQSHFMGLLLHSLPAARVLWMRRNPEDSAFSCYRNFFTETIPWCWSLSDIAHYFRIEDQLFTHWREQFPDRILTVPYEELAKAPEQWIPRILTHVGLSEEPQVYQSHRNQRSVRTASVQQVRAPISADRIGLSSAYADQLAEFRAAYYA